jgi:hypothetical protein
VEAAVEAAVVKLWAPLDQAVEAAGPERIQDIHLSHSQYLLLMPLLLARAGQLESVF